MTDRPVPDAAIGKSGSDYEAEMAIDLVLSDPALLARVVADAENVPTGDDAKSDEPSVVASGDVVSLVCASTVGMRRAKFLERDRMPLDAITLFAGREGFGKSAFLADRAARVTRGQLEGDLFGRPADVVYVGTEDAWESVLVPRLTAAGADLKRVFFVAMRPGMQFSLDLHLELLEERLADLDGVALIIIDPLDAHLGERIDSHRKSEVQRALGRLAEVAQKHHAAVVGIAHLNKSDGHDVLQRVVGSVGFTSSVRSVLAVGIHPDAERDRLVVLAKSNYVAPCDVLALRYRIEGTTVPDPDPDGGEPIVTARVVHLGEEPHDASIVVSTLGTEERTEREDAAEFLRKYLSEEVGKPRKEPVPFREIEKAAAEEGIARATLFRAAKLIEVVKTRDEQARGRPSSWALPGSSQGVSSPSQTPPDETKDSPRDSAPDDASQEVSSHRLTSPREDDDTDEVDTDGFALARRRAQEVLDRRAVR